MEESAPAELGGGENSFILNTPTRTFPLLAETTEEKLSWLAVLRAAIENPPRGLEIAAVANGGTSYGLD